MIDPTRTAEGPRGARPAPQEGDERRTRALPVRPLEHGALRTLHLDLLCRPPFEEERARWLGAAFEELVDDLLARTELWEQWLEEQLWYFLLVDNFRPAGAEVAALAGRLAEGRLDAREALHRIALMPSFDLRNPGADTWVTVVMEQICGMSAQRNARVLEVGKRLYDGGEGLFLGKRGRGQSEVLRIAVESSEAASHLVGREFRRLTRRAHERPRLAADARAFAREAGGFRDLLRSWLLSEAYAERLATPAPYTNRIFARALFVDLLGRLPEEREGEPIRGALDALADPLPLRGVLARMLLDSGEVPLPAKASIEDPRAWIAGRYERLLGGAPTAAELDALAGAFAEAACDPGLVMLALLTDPRYHRC